MALKILTVDDSKTIRMVVKKAFKPFECELFEGENGVEGLAAAAREKPDLIVLDITMPVMNGIEMLGKMKAEPDLKDIPVIMLTAESGSENVMQILKMGVKDYMVKPFKGEELIERATKLVKLPPKQAEKPIAEVSTKSSSGDLLKKYLLSNGDILKFVLPAKDHGAVIAQASGNLQSEMEKAANSGKNKLIFDLSKVSEMTMPLMKQVISTIEKCRQIHMRMKIVGNSKLSDELAKFQETAEFPVYQDVEEAEAAF